MKKGNGITLIALVITIIVLLILAGVSIITLTGENGVLMKAKTANNVTIEGEEREQITLAYNSAIAEKLEKEQETQIVAKELQLQLNNQNANAIAVDKNSKIEVTFKKTGNQYMVNGRNGKIEIAKEEIPIVFEVNGVEFKANLR